MELNKDLLFEFRNYLKENIWRSDKYCNENIYGIKEFLDWIKITKKTFTIDVEDIFMDDIEDFYIYLKNKKAGRTSRYYWEWGTLAVRTIQIRITAVKNLFKRIKRKKKLNINIDLNDIEMPQNKRRKINFLSKDEVEDIIKVVGDNEKDPLTRRRNILLIKAPFNSWLRKQELLNLRVSDLQQGNTFEIIGKGAKSRMVYINEELRQEMLAYIEECSFYVGMRLIKKDFDSDFVFISHAHRNFGDQLSGQFASNIVKNYSDIMKHTYWWTKSFTLHTLRHSFASQAVRNEVNVVVLRDMLGHDSISTTNIYTHIDDKFLKENFLKIEKII